MAVVMRCPIPRCPVRRLRRGRSRWDPVVLVLVLVAERVRHGPAGLGEPRQKQEPGEPAMRRGRHDAPGYPLRAWSHALPAARFERNDHAFEE